jgi:hypothetical protein
MPEKTLVEVESRIAKIRDEMAAGRSNFAAMRELDDLLERRSALTKTRGRSSLPQEARNPGSNPAA